MALTHYLNPCATPSESHGERMTQEPHTHWIHTCVSTPQAQFFCFICHTLTYACVCGHSCKTKLAVSHSQAVETDLPQCVHCLMRGGGIKKEMQHCTAGRFVSHRELVEENQYAHRYKSVFCALAALTPNSCTTPRGTARGENLSLIKNG